MRMLTTRCILLFHVCCASFIKYRCLPSLFIRFGRNDMSLYYVKSVHSCASMRSIVKHILCILRLGNSFFCDSFILLNFVLELWANCVAWNQCLEGKQESPLLPDLWRCDDWRAVLQQVYMAVIAWRLDINVFLKLQCSSEGARARKEKKPKKTRWVIYIACLIVLFDGVGWGCYVSVALKV